MAAASALLNEEAIRAQLGPTYDRFDPGARASHLALLRAVRRPEDVALRADRSSSSDWVVTVSTADRVGALSLISGLFTGYGIDIASADIFTLHFEQPAEEPPPLELVRGRPRRPRRRRAKRALEPSRRTLDIFRVRTTGGAGAELWEQFRRDLGALIGVLEREGPETAREQITDRVSEAVRRMRGADARLLPVEIETDTSVSPDYTRLQIRSDDSFGFLFEFTNALALLGVNIERAEIRTVGNEAHDTFWVTNAQRRKIDDEARLRDLRVAAALIKHFTHLLPTSPNPSQALRQFSALTAQMLSRPDWTAELRDLESGAVLATLAELMGVSRFLWDDFLRMQHGNLFPVIVDTPALDVAPTKAELDEQLSARLAGFTDHADRVRALNEFKDREMFRVDLRHITRRLDFVGFSRELSELADVIVSATATLAHESLQERTEGPDGSRTPWCICALGKFGGQEMGFASDVELIFVYGGEGRARVPERSQYFERFVRAFLSTLRVHRQGVFEVDLRLRPYGDAGALATSIHGFVDYLAQPGGARQFERMALVKLRHVAGDPALAGRMLEARDAFVYSGEPLDIDDILHLRGRQSAELVTPGTVNAKYSQGGLVDIEYFVQARQIEAGRDDPRVRVTGTLDGIERLEQGGHLDASDAARLRAAYAFLRRLIDALRVVRGNARDLTIPPPQSREFAYLARRLESATTAGLRSEIEAQMEVARALWPAESAEER